MMAWASQSKRHHELPDDWPQLREATKRRAGGRCERILASGERCPMPGNQCDHIIPGSDHSPGNLEWLCRRHHAEKSAAEGHAAMRAQRAKVKHPRERHPGLMGG